MVASGVTRKVRGEKSRSGQLLKTIDELGVTVASSQDSAGDEELVAAAKGRVELAFETIVKSHRQRIFALELCYALSREDAEDIVQQTFQRAFLPAHTGDRRMMGLIVPPFSLSLAA